MAKPVPAQNHQADPEMAQLMAEADKAIQTNMARLAFGPGIPEGIHGSLAALMAAFATDVPLLVSRAEVHGRDTVVLAAVTGSDDGQPQVLPIAILLDQTGLQGHIRPLTPQEVTERDAKDQAEAERMARRGYL